MIPSLFILYNLISITHELLRRITENSEFFAKPSFAVISTVLMSALQVISPFFRSFLKFTLLASNTKHRSLLLHMMMGRKSGRKKKNLHFFVFDIKSIFACTWCRELDFGLKIIALREKPISLFIFKETKRNKK